MTDLELLKIGCTIVFPSDCKLQLNIEDRLQRIFLIDNVLNQRIASFRFDENGIRKAINYAHIYQR